ncbi:MAG TPA: hypothetical protein VHP63_06035 [candidate division Zixibacteria bacterium]|nr:hypothetical protein [candidate division Zixibacteria bacterium]
MWALQFEVDRDFDFRGLAGQTLSIKKHTSDGSAFRLGLSVGLEVGESENSQGGDRDFNSRLLEISMQRVFYPDITADANLFYGIGIFGSFSHNKNEYQPSRPISGYSEFRKSLFDTWSGGVSGILGGEYFIAKSFSLLGEFRTDISFRCQKRDDDYQSFYNGVLQSSYHVEEKTNSIRISADNIKFGLSFYF